MATRDRPAGDRAAIRAAIRDALDRANPATRLIVEPGVGTRNPDALLAAVIASLMVGDRLDVEIAYLAPTPTHATRAFGLPHGSDARDLATGGHARAVPLIRDDAATVLVGVARHLGAADARLHGECYVDDARLFRGDARGIRIEPTAHAPGLRARVERTILPGRWYEGRAAQTGGTNLVVEREGIVTQRPVKRSTFYRHHIDLLLVCP
ncbi:MAG: hypothetical protein QM673_16925 [Gordonia sp. (in: high G+C Gram-positive bacteria)]